MVTDSNKIIIAGYPMSSPKSCSIPPHQPSTFNGVSEAAHHGEMCWSAPALQQACWGAPGDLHPWPSPCSCHSTPQTSQQPASHALPLMIILPFFFSITCYWYICSMHKSTRCSNNKASSSDLFVKVPGLPLGLYPQLEWFHTVPRANHWDPTICITTSLANKWMHYRVWLVDVKNSFEHALVVRFWRGYTWKGNKLCLTCIDVEFIWHLHCPQRIRPVEPNSEPRFYELRVYR